VYPKRVYLEIEPGRTGAELELWSLRKEADLLPRGLWAGAFCNAGIDVAGGAGIDEPLQAGRVVVEIDAGDGALAHADGGAAIAGDEVAEELEEDGLWPTANMPSVAGVFDQHVLKVRESLRWGEAELTSTLAS